MLLVRRIPGPRERIATRMLLVATLPPRSSLRGRL